MRAQVIEPLDEPSTKEVRVVLRNVGVINPESIEDYIAQDGCCPGQGRHPDDPR